MAINSHDINCDKTILKSQGMANGYKHRKIPGHGRLIKIDYTAESSISSMISKTGKVKNGFDISSPYLNGDSLNMISTVREKCVQKKGIMSSFPLAASLYKASSHEFKAAKDKKKVKKSVLTLPSTNNALLPQSCTVSDMNDAEYNKDNSLKKPKKRNPPASRKLRRRGNEFYDRDAQYLKQLNIDLDCSSTDMLKNGNDARCKSKTGIQPHDVWTVLRNINTFQFNPSPPMSDASFISPKKKKIPKRRNTNNKNNRKDMRVVETCRTEEFAYISSYEIDSKSPQTFSNASSFDKVTVIDNKENFNKISLDFENRLVKTRDLVKAAKPKGRLPNNRGKQRNNVLCLPGEPNIYGNQRNSFCPPKASFCGDSSLVTYQNNKLRAKSPSVKSLSPAEDSLITDDRSINNRNGSQSTACDDLVFSSYSGSSKGLLCQNPAIQSRRNLRNNPARGLVTNVSEDVTGITKVVVNKGQRGGEGGRSSVRPIKLELNKLNDREAFALNGPKIMPKLNQANIQRQLSKLTYPIVILGKDQLTDRSFEIINEESPQFHGLEKEIWPYMIEWYKKGSSSSSKKFQDSPRSQLADNGKEISNDQVERILQNVNVSSGKHVQSKDPNVLKFNTRNKYEPKPVSCVSDDEKKGPARYKPLQQIRSRMFKLLNKDLPETVKASPQIGNNTARRQNNFNTLVGVEADNKPISKARKASPTSRQKRTLIYSSERRPWSKTKWVSDFIDNVIRKIKSGAYYSSADSASKVSTRSCILDTEESKFDGLQSDTSTVVDKSLQSISKVTIKKKCEPIIATRIPGFDNSMPALQIETMNSNEIAVKHCMTNIIIRFDVTVPTASGLTLNKPTTFMPLEVTETHTRIFKCKTSILNAMLPAELCSLLPKMMKNLESSELLDSKILLKPGDKVDSRLSTIPEVLRCENSLMFRITTVSPEIGRLLDGRYWKSGKLFPTQNFEKKPFKITYDRRLIHEMIDLSRRQLLDYGFERTYGIKPQIPENKPNTCTALIPYVRPDFRFETLSFLPQFDIIENFNIKTLNTVNLIMNDISIHLTVCYPCINIVGINSVNHAMKMPAKNTNFQIGDKKLSFYTNMAVVTPAIEYHIEKKTSPTHLTVKNKRSKSKVLRAKRKFVLKNPEEKWTTLSKIRNMNDFFKALGASSALSSVFDNISGRKVLSCISQMKNWTEQINSKQALLVLLLTNKKETSSLQRYKPMLLQGISVHRITKAHELDMEIQVIEQEHLRRIPRYEGISYLPASTENQDSLFEELYWIAKTTASDYKRPFDESSEKLLRSLLEKRKKLNPSYLRVMARYVGLGLLKSPGKK